MTFTKKNKKNPVYNTIISSNEKAYLVYFKKNKDYQGWFQ